MHTSIFARHAKEFAHAAELSLSIITNGGRSLDIVFESGPQLSAWHVALQALQLRARLAAEDSDIKHLRRAFVDADTRGEGRIDYDAVKSILRRLNIYKHKKQLRALFEALETTGTGTLTFDLFIHLIDMLRDRPDIAELYHALLSSSLHTTAAAGAAARGPASLLSASAFHQFLVHRQLEAAATIDDAQRLMRHYDPVNNGKAISLVAFTSYLTSAGNSAFAREYSRTTQDMDQPLAHYFIESSHNTYLEGDQLQSSSSVNMYINVVQKGCRCVELDCWDGADDEPVIYHGGTLTSKIRFADVCRALKEYGFRASPFPLILSLEIHCSTRQQDAMADTLLSVFGDALCRPGPEYETLSALPSPNALRYRVIVKAKWKKGATLMTPIATPTAVPAACPAPTPASHEIASPSFVPAALADAGCAAPVPITLATPTLMAGPTAAGSAACDTVLPARMVATTEVPADAHGATDSVAGTTAAATAAARVQSAPQAIEPTVFLRSARLRALVFLQAVKFVSYAHSATHERVTNMSSVKEPHLSAILSRDPGAAGMILHTRRQLMRVYPGPLRVDSSNYSPSPFWAAGIQMVALNYQTPDVPMRLNRALFRMNGRCGFVLKPQCMRAGTAPTGALSASGTRATAAGEPQAMALLRGRLDMGTRRPVADAPSASPVAPAPTPEHSSRAPTTPLGVAVAPRTSRREVFTRALEARPMLHIRPHVHVPRRLMRSLSLGAAPPMQLNPLANPVDRSTTVAFPNASQLSADEPKPSPAADPTQHVGAALDRPAATQDTDRHAGMHSDESEGLTAIRLNNPATRAETPASAVAASHATRHLSTAASPTIPGPMLPSPLRVARHQDSPARAYSRTMQWLLRSAGISPHSRASSVGALHAAGPSPLLLPHGSVGPQRMTLRITIMGAQHLPKRDGSATASVPSPFCSVIIYGDPVDCAKHRTRVVPDNGFNPVWSEAFDFVLTRPEVAILYIAVHDALDVARTAFLGYCAVPLAALRLGLRSCPLRNVYGKKFPFCSLLCDFVRV